MELLNLQELVKFTKKHQTAKKDLDVWKAFVEIAEWRRPDDVKKEFKTRFIGTNRVVFKIRSDWRIDTKVAFKTQKVSIIRIGTHEEYNKWKYNK